MSVLGAILIFCFLILIHEAGHFTAAKLMGVKVNEFAIGMGPLLLQKEKGETLYSIRALPIGGYCAMEGEDETSDDERAFGNKSFLAKSFIVVAGALMNLLFAILLITIMSLYMGTETTTIGEFSKEGKAQVAGMMVGDEITKIDDKDINTWSDIPNFMANTEKDNVKIEVIRNNETKTFDVELSKIEGGRKIIGIVPKFVHNPVKDSIRGVEMTFGLGGKMFEGLAQLITGEVSAKELTGVVGMTKVVSDSIKGGIVYVTWITAFISLNLAIVNMLPFPALDGGRFLFLIIRKFTGKAISDEIEGKIHLVGILLLFSLMIYVTFQDIVRLMN